MVIEIGAPSSVATGVAVCCDPCLTIYVSEDALADVLDISPAAISGAVRYLAQVRMIRKERTGRYSLHGFCVRGDDAPHAGAHRCIPSLSAARNRVVVWKN